MDAEEEVHHGWIMGGVVFTVKQPPLQMNPRVRGIQITPSWKQHRAVPLNRHVILNYIPKCSEILKLNMD